MWVCQRQVNRDTDVATKLGVCVCWMIVKVRTIAHLRPRGSTHPWEAARLFCPPTCLPGYPEPPDKQAQSSRHKAVPGDGVPELRPPFPASSICTNSKEAFCEPYLCEQYPSSQNLAPELAQPNPTPGNCRSHRNMLLIFRPLTFFHTSYGSNNLELPHQLWRGYKLTEDCFLRAGPWDPHLLMSVRH